MLKRRSLCEYVSTQCRGGEKNFSKNWGSKKGGAIKSVPKEGRKVLTNMRGVKRGGEGNSLPRGGVWGVTTSLASF